MYAYMIMSNSCNEEDDSIHFEAVMLETRKDPYFGRSLAIQSGRDRLKNPPPRIRLHGIFPSPKGCL